MHNRRKESLSTGTRKILGRQIDKDRPLHKPRKSESQVQRHLNLARAAYRFIDDAQATQSRTGIQSLIRAVAACRPCRLAVDREVVEEEILRDIVDGDVEAGGVGKVEDLEAELGADAFGDLRGLHQGDVGSLLPGLPENIALAGGEVGLIDITRWNRPIEIARIQERQSEASGVQRAKARSRPAVAGERVRRRAIACQRDNRIGDAVGSPIEDAADRS